MTSNRTINTINRAYGYTIIGSSEEAVLQEDKDKILSELGISSIFEFLSYDVSEFSDIRKTIHSRRFYQVFKSIFDFTGFNMESFHKIQAGCLFIAALSGMTRGIEDYCYSGFVQDVLTSIGKVSTEDDGHTTLNEKFFYISKAFERFSRLSLGIYSLQLFTKYGMAIEKINSGREGYAGSLLIEIVGEMNEGKNAYEKIDRLLSLNIISPEKLDVIIDEYIKFAIADITMQNIVPGSKKTERANKKLIDEISDEVQDTFYMFKTDVADLNNLNESILKTKLIYDVNYTIKGIGVLFASLLERYVNLYERLLYYESNSFIKRLNMLFLTRAQEMFVSQRKQELKIIKNECIRIIEEGLTGFVVYDIEGVFNALEFGKTQFDAGYGTNPDDSKRVARELDEYLDANLKTANNIQMEMKDNLARILGPKGIPEEEKNILKDIVIGFDAIVDFLEEED